MSTRTSWRLLLAERFLTIGMGHTVIPLLCLSIGLTQGEIGIREVICGLTYLLFSVPTGWLADRLSRKLCNFVGDTLYGVSLIFLALSTSFSDVTIAGIIMAFGNATTHGADEALFKAHCDKLKLDYEATSKRISGKLIWVGGVHHLVGGVILLSCFGLRTTLLIASVPFFIAATISCFVQELGTRKDVEVTPSQASLKIKFLTECKGLAETVHYVLSENRKLAWLLIANAVASTMGGPIMVFIGPMILAVGGSEEYIGAAYVVVLVAARLGITLSEHILPSSPWSEDTKDTQLDTTAEGGQITRKRSLSGIFLVGSTVSLATMALAGMGLTWIVVVLHIAIVHMVRCWLSNAIGPLVHRVAPDDIQATVGSLKSSTAMVLYMVVVVVINFAGNYGVQWGIAANALLFAPLVASVVWGLRSQEKETANA